MSENAEKKPRRHLTVADHIAAHDARIARLETALAEAQADRAAYIADVNQKAAALTAALPKE